MKVIFHLVPFKNYHEIFTFVYKSYRSVNNHLLIFSIFIIVQHDGDRRGLAFRSMANLAESAAYALYIYEVNDSQIEVFKYYC